MLGFLFDPLLVFQPVIAVTIFAIIILMLINTCYRLLVNQNESKQIKERTKEMNKQMREEQKQGNTEKSNEIMKELMSENNKLMRASMKPMFASLIIIILFFPWMTSNFGDQAAILQDNKGEITIDNELYQVEVDGENTNIIKDSATVLSFTAPTTEKIGNNLYLIAYEEEGCSMLFFCHPEQVKFATVVAQLPAGIALPLIGSEAGYLGWYLLVSLPFIIILRKVLKIST